MDNVGNSIFLEDSGRWSFSSPQVIANFDFHVENSVPLYHHGHDLICALSDFFLTHNSVCYDLGCATARLSASLASRHQNLGVAVKAVDIEEEMIAQAEHRCRTLPAVELMHADIATMPFIHTDLVISYYTLQFIKPELRPKIVQKVYDALSADSAFILFEKIVNTDAHLQDMANLIHTNHKLENGYEPAEVIAKANSLRGILKPLSAEENHSLLKDAGFKRVTTVMKYLCFVGYLAVK